MARPCNFNTKYTSKIEILLPELYALKIVAWNFHMDDSQENHSYNIILGYDIWSKINNKLILLQQYNSRE